MARYHGELPALLSDFNFVFEREVAWGDMDAMNHVNNTRYLHFCESARIAFLHEDPRIVGQETPNQSIREGIALAAVDCRFKVPVVYPDTLLIGVGIVQIEDTQFTVRHELYSQAQKCIVAESHARLVNYNFSDLTRLELTTQQREFLTHHAVERERKRVC